jgi:hypothetical protein
MSTPRDEEPVGIDADASEADWIEQHQPVVDETDGDQFPTEVRENDEPIGIEADAPEADWIEQHQPVVDEAEEVDEAEDVDEADALAEAWSVGDDDVGTEDEPPAATSPPFAHETSGDGQPVDTPRASPAARGCNLIGALVHALLRSGRDPTGPIDRRDQPPVP